MSSTVMNSEVKWDEQEAMSSEILINITPMETRVALVENGVLQEVSVEREQTRGIVGNIYKGKVVRVLPGMQAAFVDIGLEKAGFLYIDDLRRGEAEGEDIRQCLHDGQSIVVQVIKAAISSKGVRLSTKLSVSSRYLVFMPNDDHIGISQRIENEEERGRLREQLDQAIARLAPISVVSTNVDFSEPVQLGGYILRTAAEGVEADDLVSEIQFLQQLWAHVSETAKNLKAPNLVYEDLPLSLRVLRDMAGPDISKVVVDSEKTHQKLCDFSKRFNPDILSALEYYSSDRPLFSLHSIEDEITKALEKTVPLKSGGSLVIEQTEAMTTVDVNTGAFVGRRNLEETTYKTNLEAASAIARQLRLRNLGGIIIIDFIDMKDAEHRRQVLRALEKALSHDRVKTTIASVSPLGLVEMTRKRSSESLGRLLCQPCSVCDGKGHLKSVETLCHEIYREVLRQARGVSSEKLTILAAQPVIDRLQNEESDYVTDLQTFVGKTLEFKVESNYSQEQFDIIPV